MKKDNNRLKELALRYHRYPTPGKLGISTTTALENQHDLSLAYSPGVAYPCHEIVDNPDNAHEYTSRGNLVGVISNGTAVLGLGDIGPLASKPVMEGKAALFKKFAGIDVFDIEINEKDPDKLIDIIRSLEPTFGAINLEDIKSPECFYIEDKLKELVNIPIFHDDQHGTAIIVCAAVVNALKIAKKDIKDIKLVGCGAGAAALACLDLLQFMGLKRDNIFIFDKEGLVTKKRKGMDHKKALYAKDIPESSMAEMLNGADVFLGLSAGNLLKPEWLSGMNKNPLIMALANPTPEIDPALAKNARPDAIIGTGRSDYPNQVNNVLCFPFIFRGALDVGATAINQEMKVACVHAIAELAQEEVPEIVSLAYRKEQLKFGPSYIIPKAFDPRLLERVAPAVAKAAMETKIASKPIEDLDKYIQTLKHYSYKSGQIMGPIFEQAKADPQRIVYVQGEDPKILRTVQIVVDEACAKPILIGRPQVIEMRLQKLGLRLRLDQDVEIVNPENDPRYKEYWTSYHKIMERKGITPAIARHVLHTDNMAIGALMVHKGEADALIAGPGRVSDYIQPIKDIIGLREGVNDIGSVAGLITPEGVTFICDGFTHFNPNAQTLAEITIMAAEQLKLFGMKPKIAMISHSQFGSSQDSQALKMREAVEIVRSINPKLEIDGEMQADEALSEEIRKETFPNTKLKGNANLLIMPSMDAANIAIKMGKMIAGANPIGPIILGTNRPAHIVSYSATTRTILNLTALACAQVKMYHK